MEFILWHKAFSDGDQTITMKLNNKNIVINNKVRKYNYDDAFAYEQIPFINKELMENVHNESVLVKKNLDELTSEQKIFYDSIENNDVKDFFLYFLNNDCCIILSILNKAREIKNYMCSNDKKHEWVNKDLSFEPTSAADAIITYTYFKCKSCGKEKKEQTEVRYL